MGDDYGEFLDRKAKTSPSCGFAADIDTGHLFPFQQDLTRWALARGRACVFADTGLGKTRVQLAWAERVAKRTNGRVLILAPLAVAQQTAREADVIGVRADVARETGDTDSPIVITNYDRLHLFDAESFSGVVLDESSILKDFTSRTRTLLIESFAATPYRLACTATPAPNDHTELGNHAQFLGIMSRVEMLSRYFINDGDKANRWRLKGHAEHDFWRWLASWAALVSAPSDLGYSDDGFELPRLSIVDHTVSADERTAREQGMLFVEPVHTLSEQRRARRASISSRVAVATEVVAREPDEQWLIWCELNDESSALAGALDGAVEVRGSDSVEHKESALQDFAEGRVRVLVTKPSIAGFGMNFQRCARMVFIGLSHSFESYYQAVRRCWRFGQERPVDAHIIVHELERGVVDNVRRKHDEARRMATELRSLVKDYTMASVTGAAREHDPYEATSKGRLPQWMS